LVGSVHFPFWESVTWQNLRLSSPISELGWGNFHPNNPTISIQSNNLHNLHTMSAYTFGNTCGRNIIIKFALFENRQQPPIWKKHIQALLENIRKHPNFPPAWRLWEDIDIEYEGIQEMIYEAFLTFHVENPEAHEELVQENLDCLRKAEIIRRRIYAAPPHERAVLIVRACFDCDFCTNFHLIDLINPPDNNVSGGDV
jgi:hypothetical protein